MRSNTGRHLVAIALLLIGIGLAVGARQMRPATAGYSPDFSDIPLQLAGMQGQRYDTDEDLRRYLEADVIETLAYGTGREQIVANIIYGASWRSVHSPAQCYPAAGWLVVEETEIVIPVESAPHEGAVKGNLMRVTRGDDQLLVLFVFAHKGGTALNYTEHSWAVTTHLEVSGAL